MAIPWSILTLIGLTLAFGFLNGFHDSANIVATMIASRAVTGRQALTLTAAAVFAGPFLFGVAVATTIGNEMLDDHAIQVSVVMAALIAAIIWNVFTWWLGIPSSSSHALIGGLIGAGAATGGWGVIKTAGLLKVLVALAISPPLGLLAGFLTMKTVLFLARSASPKVNIIFRRSQVATAVALALSHGANDGQKTMGIMAMGLVVGGILPVFEVPLWIIASSGAVMALGTLAGGWRLIKTLGGRFYKIRPVHGFTTQIASAAVVLGGALVGGPVSTTQVVSSAIMGVGAAERMSKVRWSTGGQIVMAWLTTIPATAILAAALAVILRRLL